MLNPREALELAKTYRAKVPVDVFGLARELGLGPQQARLPDNISGMIRRTPTGGMEILVNSSHAETRQRFTVAHEIGHFIYHRDRLGAGVSDTLAYRADTEECPNPAIGKDEEFQANNFAANLLMPMSVVSSLRAQGLSSEGMARALNVSRAAMRIRLGLPA